jgi:imidazolonepropionase-like amidohydrolase
MAGIDPTTRSPKSSTYDHGARMRRTLFSGGKVFDGTGAPAARADVVVEGDRIVAVGTGLDGDDAVDCAGRTILPGLIDSHVHLMIDGLDPLGWLHNPFSLQFCRAVHTMRATLAAGITTVRDAGGADLGVKEAQRLGLVAGPRVRISISLLSQTGGHGDPWEASGCHTPIFVPHPGRPTGIGVTPHGSNLDELPLLVECGMTPEQALHSATLQAARLLTVDGDLGTVEEGKLADLVLVDGDLSEVDTLAERIRTVYQAGAKVIG